MAKAEKINMNFQSKSCVPKSLKNPIDELNAMIAKEVPTAFFIGNFAKTTNAGIIKNPPPAPTKPTNVPTITPC